MEKQEIVKWLGIFIVAVMALSMLAAGMLYRENDSSSSTGTTEDLLSSSDSLSASTFTYSLSFDTIALKELNSFRMIVETSEIDKEKIDAAVESVEGVSKISSRFTKAEGEAWYYLAEITTKRGSDPKAVSSAVFALEFFSESPSSAEAMKYMTISSSKIVQLKNTDLNITRDYNFGTSTLSALISMDTQPSDEITVEGTMQLQGNTITSLELAETANLTSAEKQHYSQASLPIVSLDEGLMFQGTAPADMNIDQESLKSELEAIDQNAQVFFFSFGEEQSFFGSAVLTDKAAEISAVLEGYGLFAPIVQPATFELSSVYIDDLGQELAFEEGTVKAEVSPGHSVGDIVDLDLEVYVSRGAITGINAKEK